MDDRKCLECHEQLRGRTDQKFCSDQCRSAFNNRQYTRSNEVIKAVNKILKKNYSILSRLISEGKTTTAKSDLLNKGYRFEYFTYSCFTRSSRINYYCYDQGYREQEDDKVILVRHRNRNLMHHRHLIKSH